MRTFLPSKRIRKTSRKGETPIWYLYPILRISHNGGRASLATGEGRSLGVPWIFLMFFVSILLLSP